MNIIEIYKKYKITPALQHHQLRVAGVASILCQEIPTISEDTSNIVTACLLHDMGNIIKFNMNLFPDFFEPEGVEYWQKVQQDFIRTYGNDEHEATITIVQEILEGHKAKTRVIDLIDAIGFSNAKRNYESNDFGWKIAAYSDMRVEPYGVTTLEKRLEDGNKRFKLNKPGKSRHDFFLEMAEYLKKIEQQIFEHISAKPCTITEESVNVLIPEIRTIEIGS